MCGRTVLMLGLVGMALTSTTDTALAQKKKPAAKSAAHASATPEDYAALQRLGQIGGALVAVDAGTRTLTLRVAIPQMQPNPNYRPGQNNMSLMRRYQQALNNPNPVQRQKQLQQIAAQALQSVGNQPYKVVAGHKDFELGLQNNVAVRKLFLGVEYDDTGNVKKHTKEQLAALRGNDPAKPGYAAKLDDLQPGQEMLLLLAKAENGRPEVRLIVVTREPSRFEAAPPSPGKK